MLKYLSVVGILWAMPALAAPGEVVKSGPTDRYKVRVVTVAEGLEWAYSIAFLPGGDALVTEKPGRLRLLRDGELLPEPVATIEETHFDMESGLLDVAPHPDFSKNGLLYFYVSQGTAERNAGTVMRGRFDGRSLHNLETIFRITNEYSNGSHFGGRLVWARDGTLFVTTGDRYDLMKEAQSTENHLGKVLRINEDGSIPKDNPFVGEPGDDAIWSYGHRNVQGADLHPETGKLWTNEHGPRGGDEINIPRAGGNYGWPIATYGIDYDDTIISPHTHRPETEQPVFYWRPSIAPSGMTFYSGDMFPDWRGDIFVAALASQGVERLDIEGERVMHREVLLGGLGDRIRDVEEGPDGALYLLTASGEGRILRLEVMPAEE